VKYGFYLRRGIGVHQDLIRGAEYLKLSADQGNGERQFK
jgi:TPR repeat protein